MAMLAAKSPFPPALGVQSSTGAGSNMPSPPTAHTPSSRRALVASAATAGQSFASPTSSEFSDSDSPDAVRNWDEDRVCEYLRSVKCGEYEKMFRKNNITGENLLELDKDVLREMGVEKVGDRVRLFLSIKKLRTKTFANPKKRHRDSFAGLGVQYAPYAGSPRLQSTNRAMPSPSASKRYSRQVDLSSFALENMSRPGSPQSGADPLRSGRPSRYPTPNPGQPARLVAAAHTRNNSSMDGSMMAALPQNQDVIRVISTGGVTKVVKIADCKTCEEVMRVTLRKFALREDHERNYCFWVLTGTEPEPSQCIRLGDTELWRIIKDQARPERNRLILRRVPAGKPGQPELERSATIAMEEKQQQQQMGGGGGGVDKRSQLKVQKVLGESWDNLQQHQAPLSPATYQDRERNINNTARDLERATDNTLRPQVRRKGVLRQFGGLRPPSELIASDLTTYFPDHPREDIDRTARLSMRRSMRLSRVNSRLSVASTLSFASTIQDAPPIPTIADSWLSAAGAQPAKVVLPRGAGGDQRSMRVPHSFRDSVASSMLDTLQEEEPNRKSYYADSGSDTATPSISDAEGTLSSHMPAAAAAAAAAAGGGGSGSLVSSTAGSTVRSSFFDDGAPESTSSSLKEIGEALDADGEGADEELQSFLAGESWDESKWMKGALIGQGSFGCVYLALHAVTGELLAVKQVESANSQTDARKKSMIDALKREISLLRDLRHPNIVQYLGCGTSAECLNIFLEYVPGGSVQTMLNSYGALPEPLVRSFVRQILHGLSYLHNRDIIHRDIKGANILVDNKGTIKISDFGISKKVEATNILSGSNNSKNRPSLQGSVFWMAPEVVKQTSYTRKADIWSLGCLVVEMMTGTHPYPDCSQLQAIFKIGGGKAAPTIPDTASAEAKLFLSQTFEMDHTKRPSADELLASAFLAPIT